jgi:hypothetical protein
MWFMCRKWCRWGRRFKRPSVQDLVLLAWAVVFSVLLLIFLHGPPPEDAQKAFYKDWELDRVSLSEKQAASAWIPPDPWEPPNKGLAEASKAAFERVLERRLDALRRAEEKLSRNLYLHGLALIVAFVVLFGGDRGSGKTKLPFFDIDVPTLGVCIVLPLAFLWLWVDFGFALAHAIDLRASLWKLIQAEGGLPPDSLLSTHIALRDGGFLDIWFNAYREEVPEAMNQRSLEIACTVGAFYGVFFGLVHTTIFALVSTGIAATGCKDLGKGIVAVFSGGLLTWFLLECHKGFIQTGQPKGPQDYTAYATAGLMLLFVAVRAGPAKPAGAPAGSA